VIQGRLGIDDYDNRADRRLSCLVFCTCSRPIVEINILLLLLLCHMTPEMREDEVEMPAATLLSLIHSLRRSLDFSLGRISSLTKQSDASLHSPVTSLIAVSSVNEWHVEYRVKKQQKKGRDRMGSTKQ
jgi:hypothetical protein